MKCCCVLLFLAAALFVMEITRWSTGSSLVATLAPARDNRDRSGITASRTAALSQHVRWLTARVTMLSAASRPPSTEFSSQWRWFANKRQETKRHDNTRASSWGAPSADPPPPSSSIGGAAISSDPHVTGARSRACRCWCGKEGSTIYSVRSAVSAPDAQWAAPIRRSFACCQRQPLSRNCSCAPSWKRCCGATLIHARSVLRTSPVPTLRWSVQGHLKTPMKKSRGVVAAPSSLVSKLPWHLFSFTRSSPLFPPPSLPLSSARSALIVVSGSVVASKQVFARSRSQFLHCPLVVLCFSFLCPSSLVSLESAPLFPLTPSSSLLARELCPQIHHGDFFWP